ncbi:MAG: hypothetical protein WEB52_01010 [Dehalococcoidia bacterium]
MGVATISVYGASEFLDLSTDRVDARALLQEAVNAEIRPGPNETLHLTTRQFSRVRSDADRPTDPYHLDLYEAEPETTYVDAWFQADSNGGIDRRYTVVTDEFGNVVQEESRTGPHSELIYQSALGAVQLLPFEVTHSPVRSISIPDVRPESSVSVLSTRRTGNDETTVVEVRTMASPAPESDNAYQRPYTQDLRPIESIETLEITDNANVLRYTVELRTETNTKVLIVDTEVLALEIVPAKPQTFFELKHAAEVPVLAESVEPPQPTTYSDANTVPDGTPVAFLDPDSAAKFSSTTITGAQAKVQPGLLQRDARFASMYGLAITTTYASEDGRVLRITVGSAADLNPLLTSTPPWWRTAEPINILLDGVDFSAWLMSNGGEMIVGERDGLLLVWESQQMTNEDLLTAVSDTTVRR